MKTIGFQARHLFGWVSLLGVSTMLCLAGPDLWIRDDISDVGGEPNTLTSLFYVSDDIWIRRTADPNYDPRPFPSGSPTWSPLPHEGPCYRDPKSSSPNYLYVRVRNRGDATSSGTETLHVYWAKASTGLSWPGDWNDHLANPCGGTPRLYGFEVTKARKNAATATIQEQNDYVAAVQAINAAPYLFPDFVTYFGKQNSVHAALFSTGIHGSLRFLPWHRELMNRYEVLLREVKPALTLLYWDWTTDPAATIGYMGTFSGIPNPPFAGFATSRSKFGGTPGSFATGLGASYQSGTLLPSGSYAGFWGNIEGPSHNQSHNYIGGVVSSLNAAADPFFFMLHANCDRLWALWQRSNVARWTPALAYDASQADAAITGAMRPWNGFDVISPWQNTIPGDPNGYAIQKAPTSHSIVYPPIYDDAPLRIPPLAAGECAIIEIPFYPPPAVECGGFSDPQHLCLLARIEPVTVAEGASVWDNARNNNNIAWKNVTLTDCSIGPFFALIPWRIGAAGERVQNLRNGPARITLRFDEAVAGFNSLFNFGNVRVRLDKTLLNAWIAGGAQGTGVERVGNTDEVMVLVKGATIAGMPLGPNEAGRMDVALELNHGYQHPFGNIYHLDVLQYDDQGNDPVGGQRYDLDFNLIPIVRKGSDWKYLDGGAAPAGAWRSPNYDDRNWRTGTALFGYGQADAVTGLRGGTNSQSPVVGYFRQTFRLDDPGFFQNLALNLVRDDGLVVYLNGQEIFRQNLPAGEITPQTYALTGVTGADARAYRTAILATPGLLIPGDNVIAAEVHSAVVTGSNSPPTDISFDLELAGNIPPYPYQPPTVLISDPAAGALVHAGWDLPIRADVVDPDQDLQDVRILVDGRLLLYATNPPFSTFLLAPSAGSHRVSVLAQDSFGHLTRMESVFTALSNLPPQVTTTGPTNRSFALGVPVQLTAEASDPDGIVKEVAFYLKDHSSFGTPKVLAGVSQNPPFVLTVNGLVSGSYMVTAEARDDKGAMGYSLPCHFIVEKPAGTPPLGIRSEWVENGQLITLDWLVHGAGLEYTTNIASPVWQTIPDAFSPFTFNASGPAAFFRLRPGTACGCGTGGGCTCGGQCTCAR